MPEPTELVDFECEHYYRFSCPGVVALRQENERLRAFIEHMRDLATRPEFTAYLARQELVHFLAPQDTPNA